MNQNDLVDAYIYDIVHANCLLPAYAYYIDSNPAECSTYWYMVNKGRGYTLEDVHFVVPENLRDRLVERNAREYGAENIRYIGQTYEAEPFYIGYKTATMRDRLIGAAARKRLLTREHYVETKAQTAFHTSVSDILSVGYNTPLEKWREIYRKKLDNMDDAELTHETMETLLAQMHNYHELTRDEAKQALDKFYLSDHVDDMDLVRQSHAQTHWMTQLYTRLLPR